MSTITPHYRTIQQLLQSQSFSIDKYQRGHRIVLRKFKESPAA